MSTQYEKMTTFKEEPLIIKMAIPSIITMLITNIYNMADTAFVTCYATVLHHKKNMGKGRALKTGINAILRYCMSDTVIVTVDADGQHCVEDALAICNIAEKTPNTLVLGSRKLKENVPLRSKFGNTVTRFVYYISRD